MSRDQVPPDLPELAEHASERERDAAQIEYRADAICLAWLLDTTLFERGWEEPFVGEIIGAIPSGLFVRFGDVFEGYLPVRKLPGDYFELNQLGTALEGKRGGGAYKLGDPIQVRVDKIDKPEGKVELAPIDVRPRKTKSRPARPSPGPRRGRQTRPSNRRRSGP